MSATRTQPSFFAMLSDIALWILLIALAIAAWQAYASYDARKNPLPKILSLNFHDVSQLGRGAPVHFMGTDVGYVSAVYPQDGHIKVDVQLDRDAPAFPDGTDFTVAFNGLAGAKSLEAVLPGTKGANGIPQGRYKIEEPIRLKDVIDTQMLAAKGLEEFSDGISSALHGKDESALVTNVSGFNRQLNGISDRFVTSNTQANGFLNEMHQRAAGLRDIVTGTKRGIQSFIDKMGPDGRRLPGMLEDFSQDITHNAQGWSDTSKTAFAASQQSVATIRGRVQASGPTLQQRVGDAYAKWDHTNAGLKQFDAAMAAAAKKLGSLPLKTIAHDIAVKVNGVKKATDPLPTLLDKKKKPDKAEKAEKAPFIPAAEPTPVPPVALP